MPAPLHLAAALTGCGWHSAAWREPQAQPTKLFDARYWTELVKEAEKGLLDLVTIEDSVGLQSAGPWKPDDRIDQVRGRLDATLIAARVAPLTRHIGLIPTVIVTHIEPFHVSKAIATLDYVSNGRAGVRVKVSARADEAALFGRRQLPEPTETLFEEAADFVEVIRRLWDSWEDDAEIRDVATGRFVDREKLHYIDFHGAHFEVKGPSITPRPPQGQPVVAALAHAAVPFALVGRSADLGFITPHTAVEAAGIVAQIRTEQDLASRGDETVYVFADLDVFLDSAGEAAVERKARLDQLAGREHRSDAEVFVGTVSGLADLMQEWQSAGLSGFRLRPGVIPDDLQEITRSLVPELQRRGLFRESYEANTLRGLLKLGRPANRYARS